MASVDYMKALDIIADSLSADQEIHVEPRSNDLKTLSVTMKGIKGELRTFVLIIEDYRLKIEIPGSYLPGKKPDAWLRDLEFRLEQAFLVNIYVDVEKKGEILHITLAF